MYKNILFDFDGTMYDTSKGIINATKYALNEMCVDYSKIDLKKFIGPPLQDSFKYLCNIEDENVLKAIELFRVYYREQGLYESELCSGMERIIKTLKNKKYKLFVASSKPTLFIEKLLTKDNIIDYFDYISGSPIKGESYSKYKVIKEVFNKFNLNKDETIMIGDTIFDIIGAQDNKIDAIGVTYCTNNYKELDKVKPKYIVNNTLDLLEIIK